jgi:hypothetical protein
MNQNKKRNNDEYVRILKMSKGNFKETSQKLLGEREREENHEHPSGRTFSGPRYQPGIS